MTLKYETFIRELWHLLRRFQQQDQLHDVLTNVAIKQMKITCLTNYVNNTLPL